MSNQSTWAESFQGPGHAQGVLPPVSAPTVQHEASLWPMSNQSTWVESSQGPGHAQGVLPHVSAPTVKETLQCPRSNQSTWVESSHRTGHGQGVLPHVSAPTVKETLQWPRSNQSTWAESSQGTGHAQGVLPHVSAVDRTVLEALREIDLKIGYLTSLVESFIGGRRILPPQQLAGEEEVNFIPLNSIEDLENMEERLQNNELRQRMISMLSLSGGASMQKTIWRIASKLLTADLAKNLNWCGRGNKRGLKKTLFGQMIIGAAMKNPILPAPTEADAEKCLKDYLRLAPGRR
ncbi:uncharacterized protein LOC111189722 [Astyanax mexicanus]|uniref:uncharacterized protein LOC111189722 n=1 Tax=Astyanax mexicanus TaxID=7994 RepID=UPI0020CAD185|nr:uncharacterized protein LOC111189722 [Astyanax mexicanus]